MAVITNLGALLRTYTNMQNSAFVNRRDFLDYVKTYAERHVAEDAELAKYLGENENISAELERLAAQHLVALYEQQDGRQVIAVISYYSAKFAQRYKEISTNPMSPFPTPADLPKQLPNDAIEKKNGVDLIPDLLKKQDLKSSNLFCVLLPHNTPSILFPECVPIQILTDAALAKIRALLKKDEYHDYFFRKLQNANPGKKGATRIFFESFMTRPEIALKDIGLADDTFYFWNQLCYFIREDFGKAKDLTSEDANILQAVAISEIRTSWLKDTMQQTRKKDTALKNLEAALEKPPYYFSMDSIVRFTDSKGVPLYGQYNKDDVKNFLETLTTKSDGGNLPRLLVFGADSGAHYFIYKTKVFPLIVRLCTEAHTVIQKKVTNRWLAVLQNYETLPEMHDPQKFEAMLESQVRKDFPVLYALLNANFLPLLYIEMQNSVEGSDVKLFSDGWLLPYNDLLMIDSKTVLESAKAMLPLWYTIPILSRIIGFFIRLRKRRSSAADASPEKEGAAETKAKPVSQQEALKEAAKTVKSHYVPEGSTLDDALGSYLNQWNKLIGKEAHDRLTADVNALIRDYMRRIIHTISAKNFTVERVESLAETLCKMPNLQKISERDALYMYIQLYIVRLVTRG